MVSPSGTASSVRGTSAHRRNGRSSPMRARGHRLSLLGQFSLLSLMLIAALGAVLATVLEGQIERRALEGAEQLALVTAQVGVAPHLTSRDLLRPMSPLRLSQLDTDLHQTGLDEVGLVRVKIYNSHAGLVYSDDRRLIGESELESGKLREALGGGLASDVENGTEDTHNGRRVLEVYTPLRLGDGAGVDGALEIYLSYDPVAAAVAREKRTLYLFLGIGLAFLYAVLFRVVAGASRRLRHLALHDALTGAAEPLALPRARRARDQGLTGGPDGRGAAHRPRPLQGGQRHARPRPRRRAAQGRRRAPRRGAAPRRHARSAGRRRVRRRARRPAPPRRGRRAGGPAARRAATPVRAARHRRG